MKISCLIAITMVGFISCVSDTNKQKSKWVSDSSGALTEKEIRQIFKEEQDYLTQMLSTNDIEVLKMDDPDEIRRFSEDATKSKIEYLRQFHPREGLVDMLCNCEITPELFFSIVDTSKHDARRMLKSCVNLSGCPQIAQLKDWLKPTSEAEATSKKKRSHVSDSRMNAEEVEDILGKDLGEYFDFFEKIGFAIDQFSPKKVDWFRQVYSETKDHFFIVGMLGMMDKLLTYDCETGMWPNPYDELVRKYLTMCGHNLPGFYSRFQFHEPNSKGPTEYKVLLTNGEIGYLVIIENYSDWYNPLPVDELLNRALADVNCPDRFVQLYSGDQTVCVAYCQPGQLRLLVDKYGLEILSERKSPYL